jgi:ankyrin repeat protein
LYRAAEEGHSEVVQVLLDAGAQVDFTPGDGQTALHGAVESGEIDLVEFLISRGANPKQPAMHGTLLHEAALSDGADAPQIARRLVELRLDPNARGPAGATALLIAVREGNVETAQVLLDVGANPNLADDSNETALLLATQTALLGEEDERWWPLVHALLRKGANPNIRSKTEGKTAAQLLHGPALRDTDLHPDEKAAIDWVEDRGDR